MAFHFFKKKKPQEIPEVEETKEVRFEDTVAGQSAPEHEETEEINAFEDIGNANPYAGTEQGIDTSNLKEESRSGKRLNGKLIASIVTGIAFLAVGAMAYNALKPKATPQRPQANITTPTATVGSTPASNLPSSYSDLAKYERERKQKERDEMIKAGKLNPARDARLAREKQQAEAARQAPPPNVRPPATPSLPPGYAIVKEDPYKQYNTPVGFQVTESGKVGDSSGIASIFTGVPGTTQAVGKKYKLHAGTVIPATMISGLTSDSSSAGVVAQVRQDVYDSLTGTHLLIPQGTKIIGTGGGTNGKRMDVSFDRIILPNGASIKLSGPHATDGMGYKGMKDKYDEKWGPTMKGAFLAGIFTGIADTVGDIDTRSQDGSLVQSAWGNVAAKVSDRLGDKADKLDKNTRPAVIIRPGFQFQVYLTEDIEIYGYQPLDYDPR